MKIIQDMTLHSGTLRDHDLVKCESVNLSLLYNCILSNSHIVEPAKFLPVQFTRNILVLTQILKKKTEKNTSTTTYNGWN
jgi:hypothetical protein